MAIPSATSPYRLVRGDCVKYMKDLEEGSVDLVFADPPFNIDYNAYDKYDDDRPPAEYLGWVNQWVVQCLRILKRTGSLWIAIGDEYVSEIDVLVKASLPKGWSKRSHVIWYYTFGVNCADNFARSHTHLLYYCHNSSPKRVFNKDDPKLRHASSRQLVYNDKRANPKGRLPDNTWVLNPFDLDKAFSHVEDTWIASRIAGTFGERAVRGTHGEQRGVPQMPALIMDRIIRAVTRKGDRVVDPFVGNGTTGEAAVRNGCQFLGIDISQACVKMSRSRIEQALAEPKEGPETWAGHSKTDASKKLKKRLKPRPKPLKPASQRQTAPNARKLKKGSSSKKRST